MLKNLLAKNDHYHGEKLANAEAFAPMAESMIVLRWLEAIHPSLHRHIQETRAYHCLQLLSLVLQISSQIYASSKLEQEIEQVDGVSALFAQDVTPVEVNRVTCRIGGRGGFKNFATKPWSRPNQNKTFKNMPFRHSLAEFRDLILGDCYARDLTDKCQVNISNQY